MDARRDERDARDVARRADVASVAGAVARGRITMLAETARRVAANDMKKGDVLGAARFAGAQAAKDAASYLPLSDVERVKVTSLDVATHTDAIEVVIQVVAESDAGARAYALTATTVALLTIYDMCKSVDRTMTVGPVEVI